MHILYLSVPGGGLDTNVRVLAPALFRAGHHVSILYVHFPKETLPEASTTADGYNVYHAEMGSWHYYASRATFGRSSLPLTVRAFDHGRALARAVGEIHAHEPIDLVELPEAFVTPRWMGHLPYVMRLHASAWMCRRMFGERSPLSDSIEVRLESYSARNAAAMSAPSQFIADYIRQTCGVKHSIEIIPYPIDTTQFAPGGERGNPPYVFFVGRVEERKGAGVLMDAMQQIWAKHSDCEFVLAGRISEGLESRVAAMPSRVRFLGARPRGELLALYQRSAIFAAPSLWDNSPNTVYEAMACGTPIVATRVGGIPELVDEGVTGLLVPPRDAAALADAIVALLDDPARCARMGRCAREKAVAEFAVDQIVARTLKFYEHALGV